MWQPGTTVELHWIEEAPASTTTVKPTHKVVIATVTNGAAMLDSLPYVERYSWFALPSEGEDTGLYRSTGQPTDVGLAYKAAS